MKKNGNALCFRVILSSLGYSCWTITNFSVLKVSYAIVRVLIDEISLAMITWQTI